MAAPQLRLEVSLNLSGFRSEIQKLTNIAQSEFAPKINVKFNRRTLDTELNNLQAAIKRRVYRIEIGGNIDALPDKIRDLKKELASLESFKIDLGIGAVQSLSKKDASKIKSDLRAEILGTQKKIYVPVSIRPSIARQDVRDFKNAVQSQLTGLSVKVKADLEAASISGGAKSRSDIDADVRRKLQEISEIGAQRMAGGGGGVTEAARRQQLRRSLATGGFDIGGLKDIGKQLGVAGVGRFKNVNSLINKIVTDSSIEMVKKYLDPQAVMRSSDRSGLGKVLDIFARGVFNMLGMDPASIRAQQQSSRQKAFTPAGLLPEYTSRGAREEIMRRLGGADGGRDGKLALSNEAMGQRISAILQEYFKIAEVQVRESFNPRELKQSLNVFSYIVQSLRDAETRTKQARVDESVDSLMNTISQSLKIAEATARIRLAQVRELPQRPSQGMLPGTRIAGLLSPESAGRYRGGGAVETREELFARREREARMRSALRGLSVSSERGLELPGTTFMGDDFTRGGGRDRVTGSGQPPQRGGAIMRHPGGPQLGPASRLPSDYFDKGSTTDKYREGLRLAAAATDSFRAGQIPFLSGLKSIAGEFGEATKQVLLYGTAYKGLAFITSLPGQILNAAKSQQQFNNGLQTATQSTGTFAKELLYVDNVQRAFGLNLQTTRTGFTRLFASMAPTGFDSGSIEKLFTGISAATASLQLTPDKAERVIYAFGQMASKGQIMSEELKGQLGDVLPGALSLFADAAGMSVKEFSEAMEKGEFVGDRFREVFAKVSDELMNRFGTGAQAAARSLQGLINVVGGDFQRTLESFAPLANAAAESILKPLGGAFRQLSVAARLATGEKGRLGGQVTQQEELVRDLGAEASLGGPDAEEAKKQYEGAKQALEALKIQLENFNELAKDPAVIKQAENIKAFTDEIGKAASFVQNFVSSIGSALSPILAFLGTNLTSVIGTVISLTLAFQGARLGLLAFVGVMTVIKGAVAAVGLLSLVQQVGSFSAALAVNGTLGKTVATIFTALGVSAKFAGGQIVFASGATMSFGLAAKALLATTGLGLLILVIGSVGAAFAAMGEDAKRAAEDAKQAAKDMAEAARTGNVFQVEAGIRQAQADVPLIKEAQSIVKRGQLGVAFETLDRGTLTEEDQAILSAAGLSLPDGVVYKKDLLKQLNDLLAVRNSVLSKGKAQLALAEKQRKRTGEGIPSLGLKSTELPEKDDAAEQRGKTLLNAIEQREEAIADARKQREESIASIRKNAAEEFMRMEQALADRRLNIEREIIAVKRKSADTLEDIQRQIRIARGEDSDIVGDEQKVADIYRKERDANLEITQRIADEEKEQARNIAAFQKKVANDIQSANEAHTKRMGEIQQGYAKQVAKIVEEGSTKAGQRLAKAAQMASLYMQRGTQNNLIGGTTGFVIPERTNGVYDFGTQGPRSKEQVRKDPSFKDLPTSIDNLLRIDDKLDQLKKDLNMSRKPDIGQQFTAMLEAEGGYESVAMTRGQAAIIIKKLETAAIQKNITPDAFAVALQQVGGFAQSPDESRRAIRNMMATPGAGMAVRSPGLLRNLATRQLSQDQANIQASGVNPASLKKQIEPMLAIMSQLQKDNLLRKNVSVKETKEQIQKPLYGALMDWIKANLNNTTLQEILKRSIFGANAETYGVKGLLPLAAGFEPKSFGVGLTPFAQKEKQEYEQRKRYEATPAGRAAKAAEEEYARQQREFRKQLDKKFGRQSASDVPEGFDTSKVATDFGTIAAASILRGVLDVSRVPDASRSAQIAQAHNVNVGNRVGYYQPQSQQTSPAGAPYDMTAGSPEAARTTESRGRLQSTVQDTGAVLTAKELELLYARITEDSAKASAEMTKQIDLIKKQAALIRNGINSELAAEFVQLEANYNKEVDRIEARKLEVAAKKILIKEAEKLRDTLKAQTKERILQSKILAGEQAIEKLKEEIKLLLIINDEERKLAELREQYGDAKAQEVFDLTKIKENIEATRALVDGFVSGTASDYKGFLKAVISGEDAVDALKQFQAGLTDKVLTIFLDFTMAPVEKFFKESLGKLFLPKAENIPGLNVPKETTKDPVQATNSNTNATLANTEALNKVVGALTGTAPVTAPTAPAPASPTATAGPIALPAVPFDPNTATAPVAAASKELNTALTTNIPNALKKSADETNKAVPTFQESLGKVTAGIGIAAGSIMGIAAGIGQIKEGGTSNVLGGIGSVLMSLGGAVGGFAGFLKGANGGIAGGGWKPFPVTAFANGGMVNGPTLGLVGEGKYNEAIVPLPDGKSIPVQMRGGGGGGGGLREAMSGSNGRAGGSPILNMSFQSTNINGVEYVSRDQLEQAMAATRRQAASDGANRGMSMTLDKLQQSPSTRSRLGIGGR
jgi:tape measure domain-containing protein